VIDQKSEKLRLDLKRKTFVKIFQEMDDDFDDNISEEFIYLDSLTPEV